MLTRIKTSVFDRILMNGLSLGIIVLNRDYEILLWNYWMEKHTGIKLSDIKGQNIFQYYPDIQKRKKAKYLTDCIENARTFLLSPFIHHYFIPLDIVKENERLRMFQNVRIYPLVDENKQHGLIIIIEDMTEQILHEKEISRLNQVLRGIRNVNQLITRVGSEDELFTGACDVLIEDIGYRFCWIGLLEDESYYLKPVACEGISHNLKALDDKLNNTPIAQHIISEILQAGKSFVIDNIQETPIFEECRKFAQKRGCQSTCILPLKLDDQVIGAITICSDERNVFHGEELELLEEVASDISFSVKTLRERKKKRQMEQSLRESEAKLRQAQKMEAIGALAGGIAHDFNNILYPIIGYTELTLGEFPQENVIRNNMREILIAANRAKNLVSQILTFSRRSEHFLEPIFLYPIIKEAIRFLRSSLPSSINIYQHIDKDCGTVLADPTQMYQVVVNLCTNAAHAIGDNNGMLEIELVQVDIFPNASVFPSDIKPGNYVKLSVSDTGTGISPEIIDRIFEPYFTTKEKGKGTGMGLALVHGIVKSHGGQIQVQSQDGKGSQFNIYLPWFEGEGFSPEMLDETLPPGGEARILLVDDEEQNVYVMQQILESLGYTVTARTSSKEILDVFRKAPEQYDLLITDQTMPEMTGDQLSLEFLKIRPEMPIILCTGYSEKLSPEAVKNIGIQAFISKPVGTRKIAETIQKILNES